MTSTSLTRGGHYWLLLERLAKWMAGPFAWLSERLNQRDDRLLGLRTEEPRTDEEVLAWASRIAATQPSYAADLRAAVLRKQGLEEL
jgi:hypothetical protein